MQKLLSYGGRPCQIIGDRRKPPKNPKWGKVDVKVIRYLDGRHPDTDEVPAGRFGTAAKPIRDTETIYWLRVDELIRGGMEAERAKAQARAEAAKGILATSEIRF